MESLKTNAKNLAIKLFSIIFLNDIDQLNPHRPPSVLSTVMVYSTFAQFVVRFTIFSILVYQDKVETYLKYDMLFATTWAFGFRQYAIYLAGSLVVSFFILAHYQLYHNMDYTIWWNFRQMIQVKAFLSPEATRMDTLSLATLFHRVYETARMLWKGPQSSDAQYSTVITSKSMPWQNLSSRDMSRLVLYWFFNQFWSFCLAYDAILGTLTVGGYYYLQNPNWHYYSYLTLMFTLLDATVTISCLVIGSRCVVLYFAIMHVYSYAFLSEYWQLYRFMRNNSSLNRENGALSIRSLVNRARTLQFYRRWHARLTVFLARYNRYFISKLTYSFILCELPVNGYIVSFLMFNRLPPIILLLTMFASLVMVALPGTVALILAAINVLVYSTVKHLHRLIRHRDGRFQCSMQEQWKSCIYYEMLHRKDKKPLVFTIGTLGNLSVVSLAELALTQIAFLLYFISNFMY